MRQGGALPESGGTLAATHAHWAHLLQPGVPLLATAGQRLQQVGALAVTAGAGTRTPRFGANAFSSPHRTANRPATALPGWALVLVGQPGWSAASGTWM